MDEMEERTPEPTEEGTLSFAEERLRLEREALAVERERLAAARAHAEAEASLMQRRRRPEQAEIVVSSPECVSRRLSRFFHSALFSFSVFLSPGCSFRWRNIVSPAIWRPARARTA